MKLFGFTIVPSNEYDNLVKECNETRQENNKLVGKITSYEYVFKEQDKEVKELKEKLANITSEYESFIREISNQHTKDIEKSIRADKAMYEDLCKYRNMVKEMQSLPTLCHTDETKERHTFALTKGLHKKIKLISLIEGFLVGDVASCILKDYINKYEQEKGKL